jgi:flagellar protein FlaG
MNTIGINGQRMAMDGHDYSVFSVQKAGTLPKGSLPTSASEVLKNIEQNKADVEASVKELQKLSDMVTGHKLHFNVNDELNKVIVTVVDANTNEVIRQIPSEDIQKIQARMRQAIGVLFDEMI